jgi:hypothetical protein
MGEVKRMVHLGVLRVREERNSLAEAGFNFQVATGCEDMSMMGQAIE